MENTELSWLFLIDLLTDEGRPAPYIRIIDTIFFDVYNSLRPLFWVYTSEVGQICKFNLRDWTIPEIIDNVLKVYNSHDRPTMILVQKTGARDVIDSPTPNKIINHNLQALQLFTKDCGLDKRIYIYHLFGESEEKCYYIENARENMVEISNPVGFRVKAISGLVMQRLKLQNSFKIISVKMLYHVDKYASDPWLIGFAECIASKPHSFIRTLGIKQVAGPFVKGKTMSINENLKDFTRGMPIIRGNRAKAALEGKKLLSKSVINLQDEISKTFYPQLEDLNKALPVIESCYQRACRGQFCKVEMIRLPKYDLGLRCLIPFYLLELAQKSDYSPFVNPDLRKIPQRVKQIGISSQVLKKVHYMKEVPVCLKCFVVYYNIKKKQLKINRHD